MGSGEWLSEPESARKMLGTLNTQAWFVQFQPNTNASLRLICFPYAGGGPHVFRSWLNELPSWIELVVAQLPGHGTRILEQHHVDVDELVPEIIDELTPELDQPYAIFGHSLGALLGYEVVRRLQSMGAAMPVHLFVSARMAPQLPDLDEPVYNLPKNDFIAHLQKINGTPRQVLENQELMEVFLPVLRSDFQLNETYQFTSGPRLNCPVTVFGGIADTRISQQDLLAWKDLTDGPFEARMFPGDHFFLHSEQHQLVQRIVTRLSNYQLIPYSFG